MNLTAGPAQSYLAHKAEIDAAIERVLASGTFILGDEVESFEREFASYVHAEFAVGVGSGTDALQLALRVFGIGPGDEVVTASHTAVATVAAIELAGARPVLIDIDPRSFALDPNLLEDTLKNDRRRSIKAVIPVHLYGHPADMPAICEIASTYEVKVIEDCAQSHGASIGGKMTGNWGQAGAFSFYPTKNLGALGDAGALALPDAELTKKARLLRQYGWKRRFVSEAAGMNSRLDPIQAAVLRVKLPYLDDDNGRRRHLGSRYDRVLPPDMCPLISPGVVHVFHQYVIQTDRRAELERMLTQLSVPWAVHYPLPVHLQPAYRGRVGLGQGGMQRTEKVCRSVMSLPIHPCLDEESVDWLGRKIAALDEEPP